MPRAGCAGARSASSTLRTPPTTTGWPSTSSLSPITSTPDVVLFVNGLPLGLIELKNPADEDATIRAAWNQLQTYKAELPTLFAMNEALVVSDGIEARLGTLTAGWEWFKPWCTIGSRQLADLARTRHLA